jgi:perosamine synthetase
MTHSLDGVNGAAPQGRDASAAVNVRAQAVVDAVASAIGPGPAPLHEPRLDGAEWAYVKECLDTGWVSTAGRFVARFEQMLAERLGAAHVIAVANGTVALQVALEGVGARSGDEVIAPSFTFVATANAVAHCGAVPHFVDIEASTLGLDAAALDARLRAVGRVENGVLVNGETGRRIAAVVCMHTYGHPCDMEALSSICAAYSLPLVEDAAESLGSTLGGRHMGTFGRVGTLSFNGNKIATTGGGGAVLTNDESLAAAVRHRVTTAKTPHPYEMIHDEVGYNFRLTNVAAAIGCAQLESLERAVADKRALAERYIAALAQTASAAAAMVSEAPGRRANYWINVLRLTDATAEDRNAVIERLIAEGYECRAAWRPMHMLPMYAAMPRGSMVETERAYREAVNLPSGAALAGRRPFGV